VPEHLGMLALPGGAWAQQLRSTRGQARALAAGDSSPALAGK
jgi:hypothetical protein